MSRDLYCRLALCGTFGSAPLSNLRARCKPVKNMYGRSSCISLCFRHIRKVFVHIYIICFIKLQVTPTIIQFLLSGDTYSWFIRTGATSTARGQASLSSIQDSHPPPDQPAPVKRLLQRCRRVWMDAVFYIYLGVNRAVILL